MKANRSFLCLLVVVATLLAAGGCGGSGAVPVAPGGSGTLVAPSPGESAWALRVLELTNEERAAFGLAPLELDPEASVVAYAHCWDMHLRDFFDHTNPDGLGPEERLAQHGVSFDVARENLARGHATPESVVQGWMASDVHRANILYPGWTRVGIAVHSGPDDGPWWAQEFMR